MTRMTKTEGENGRNRKKVEKDWMDHWMVSGSWPLCTWGSRRCWWRECCLTVQECPLDHQVIRSRAARRVVCWLFGQPLTTGDHDGYIVLHLWLPFFSTWFWTSRIFYPHESMRCSNVPRARRKHFSELENLVVSSMSVDNSPVDFTPTLKQEFVIVQACIFFPHSSKLWRAWSGNTGKISMFNVHLLKKKHTSVVFSACDMVWQLCVDVVTRLTMPIQFPQLHIA